MNHGPSTPEAEDGGIAIFPTQKGVPDKLGGDDAEGEATRTERLALFLIYARLAHQGSRLSAARYSEDYAVREILEVGSFDEEDLYAALGFLDTQQERIENALHQRAKPGTLFLYDVTSVYFEGQLNELAAFGYNPAMGEDESEDRGDVRDALRRVGAAFHRPHFRGGHGPLLRRVRGTRADGIGDGRHAPLVVSDPQL